MGGRDHPREKRVAYMEIDDGGCRTCTVGKRTSSYFEK